MDFVCCRSAVDLPESARVCRRFQVSGLRPTQKTIQGDSEGLLESGGSDVDSLGFGRSTEEFCLQCPPDEVRFLADKVRHGKIYHYHYCVFLRGAQKLKLTLGIETGQKSNFEVSLRSRWVTIPRFKLGEKSIGDGPRSPKCFLGQIRAQ